jgi:hypothetical protein
MVERKTIQQIKLHPTRRLTSQFEKRRYKSTYCHTTEKEEIIETEEPSVTRETM